MVAFSRNSLYTFFSRNPTNGIPPCLRISKRKYLPMPSESHNRKAPLPFGNPKRRPWYRYGYFLESPIESDGSFQRNTQLINSPKSSVFIIVTVFNRGRRSGLMFSAVNSGASTPGSSPGRGHCVVFLGKTLYSHSASLHSGV